MQYRLLCCSDTHGRVPPGFDEAGATAWLHAGDVANGWDKAAQAGDFDDLDRSVAAWFKSRSLPIYIVRGNHDFSDPYGAFAISQNITGLITKISPQLFIAGIGWHGQYHFDLPTESDLRRTCDEIRRQARWKLQSSDSLILLTHYPARLPDLFDMTESGTGVWYYCIRDLVNELQPVAVVQGHAHSLFGKQGTYRVGTRDILVVNPGRGGAELILDTEDHAARVAELRMTLED